MMLSSGAYAGSRHLTPSEIERLKACQESLIGVDLKSLEQSITELEKTAYPQINLQIKEAMVRTYQTIAEEQGVSDLAKKKWLYSMVALNMAYLQFGGERPPKGQSAVLNSIIIKKLKENLPAELINKPGFLYTMEE